MPNAINVAVICNCYKRLPFTELCLPYALLHAGMDAQWLLADDASGDGTAELLRTLEKDGVEVRAHKQNRGHYVRRNEGFEYGLACGADVVVNIDNDILFPQNWLRDLVDAFMGSNFGVGSAWIVNDNNLRKMLIREAGGISDSPLNRWINTGGCGGAAIAHKRAVLETPGCRYDERKLLFTYGDAAFNGIVKRAGFKVGIYLGVQCWHLQTIVWLGEDYEKWKLGLRHKHVHGINADMKTILATEKFAASFARLKKGRIIGGVHEA